MYFTASAISTMDAVLGYIANFIATLPGWVVDVQATNATPNVTQQYVAGGRRFIAHKGACLVGLRSVFNLGNTSNQLMLFDGIGPYTSGDVGNLNGNSGWNSLYSDTALSSGVSTPANNPNFYAPACISRGFLPYSSPNVNPGPYPNLYLFSNTTGDYVHAVLQIDSLNFRHLLFGNIIQYGTWNNPALGGYFAGTVWNLQGYGYVQGGTISDAANVNHGVPFQL